MDAQQDLPLPAAVPSGVTVINPRCSLRAHAEHRVVVVAGLPVHHYSADDAVAEAYAMVFLVDGGYATQREVAVAFGCTERTVRRHQDRYHNGGMAALATRSGWRAGRRRVPTKRVRVIERLRAQGVSNREIARRLGIAESAVRKQVGPSERGLERQQLLPLGNDAGSSGRNPPEPGDPTSPGALEQPSAPDLPEESAGADEPATMTLDVDPTDRTWDRLLACFGLLDDAQPIFASATAVPGAGVLCAVPVLVASGVFDVARTVYGGIGPAFYGLRTTLLTLLLMALWRIKRPEALKEHDPQTLGRMLGLDRAPEVKTIRRKLTRLAGYHRAEQFGAALARLRVERRGQLLGFLYVDGHVRVYHGTRTLPKAHVARMRLSMPATTDYWVNDQAGDPLFVMTAPANAGLVKMLPEILGERLGELLDHRRELPQRVEVREVSQGAVVKLATERKHLTNLIKMLAYQAESDLLAFIRSHYARADEEGRTLLHELFHLGADLDVTDAELRVTLGPLSSPHRTLAVQALCETLTESATVFPGTRLAMRFAVHAPRRLGMAFPGPRPRPSPGAAVAPIPV